MVADDASNVGGDKSKSSPRKAAWTPFDRALEYENHVNRISENILEGGKMGNIQFQVNRYLKKGRGG